MIRPYQFRPLMLCVLVLAVALGGFGCGDDDPVTPQETFEVTLEVVDTEDNPVPGLEVGLLNNFPGFHYDVSGGTVSAVGTPDKAKVGIEFIVAEAAHIRIKTSDIEGNIVRALLDEYYPEPGYRLVYWDGEDNAGVHLPSGIYTVILEATTADGKSVLFADAKDMYMALLQRYVHGPTDEDGLLVFTDQKLFPQLYDCQVMTLCDEAGDPYPYPMVSVWIPTEEMYFRLYDPVNQVYQGFFVDVSAPGDLVKLIWNPTEKMVCGDGDAGGLGSTEVLVEDARAKNIDFYEWRLENPRPNPFN